MSLSPEGLKTALMNAMSGNPESKDKAMEMMAKAIVEYLLENLEVKIPDSAVITGATGQVVVTKNNVLGTGSIECEVS